MIVRGRLKELQPVAPGVLGVETADARERHVVGDFYAAGEESLAQVVEIVDSESGMGLPCGAEIRLDADMELLVTAFEPAAASDAQRLRFLNLPHAEENAIEFTGGGFAASGSGDLDVIEASDSKLHIQMRIPTYKCICIRRRG